MPRLVIRRRNRRRLPRPPVWLHPRFLERRYLEMLNRLVVDKLITAVRNDVFPQLKRLVFQAGQFRPDSAGVRLDDAADDIEKMVQSLSASLGGPAPEVSRELQDLGSAVSTANRQQWKKIIRKTVGVDVFQSEPYLATQLSLFTSTNAGLITKMQQDAVSDVQGIVERGLQQGLRVEEIEQQIIAKTGAVKNKAKLIARDQVSKANAALTELRQTDLGVTKYIWRTSKDERVRGKSGGLYPKALPKHSSMEGKTCIWSDPTVYLNEDGKKRKRSSIKGVQLHPGQDFQCLPGDSQLNFSGGTEMLYRRWYTGELAEIVTTSAITLRATPNHPILTTRGWIPIGEVDIGDYVIEARLKARQIKEGNIYNRVPTCAEVFDTVEDVSPRRRRPGTTSQFHGDGTDNEIDIVLPDGFLSDVGNLARTQDVCKLFLSDADATIPDLLSGPREGLEMLRGSRFASEAIIRSAYKILALFDTQSGHSDSISVTRGAWRHAMLTKTAYDNRSGYSKLIGELEYRRSLNEGAHHSLLGYLLAIVCRASLASSRVMPSFSELEAKVVGIDPERDCDVLEELPFLQQPARILEKHRSEFTGHVYNLQSQHGYYIADSCIVRNCRCTAEPVLSDLLE